MKAVLKNYRQSPRKVRLVADLVRGKRVSQALNTLDYLTKRASDPVRSVIKVAAENAKHNWKIDPENLVIKEIRVDEGVMMKRSMPRARGSAYPIRKRTSHIVVVLGEPQKMRNLALAESSDSLGHSDKVAQEGAEGLKS